jgi:proline dehydrogenase
MRGRLRSRLRAARYALPAMAAKMLPVPNADKVLETADRLRRHGLAATLGYFHAGQAGHEAVAAANLAALAAMQRRSVDTYLSVKAPALDFDWGVVREIAAAAAAAGTTIVFDAHGPGHAVPTLGLAEALLADFPGTGCVLPARWRRSRADAARLRDGPARIRLVRGEWADPEADPADWQECYLQLVACLAGRAAPVAIATHRPELAAAAIGRLIARGTPCELEQLRGMPSRRTMAVARRLGVPIRVYLPFGPGWWPYAIDKALARPSLALGLLQDRLAPVRA